MWEKSVGDVKTGRAIALPARSAGMVRGLWINPVGVVGEGRKRKTINDSTFSGKPEGEGGGWRQVNETTCWDQITECHLADMMLQIVRRILRLKDKLGSGSRIQEMDVKSAFRQVGGDPAGAMNFVYVLGDNLFVDLRMQFGWRESPGWRGVIASAIQQAQRQTA